MKYLFLVVVLVMAGNAYADLSRTDIARITEEQSYCEENMKFHGCEKNDLDGYSHGWAILGGTDMKGFSCNCVDGKIYAHDSLTDPDFKTIPVDKNPTFKTLDETLRFWQKHRPGEAVLCLAANEDCVCLLGAKMKKDCLQSDNACRCIDFIATY